MSVSRDAILCYGFPILDDNSVDFEGLWELETGFKPSREIFNKDGSYIGGEEPPEAYREQYYNERTFWRESHPLPFEVVYHCCDENTMYILALPDSELRASRGDLVKVRLADGTRWTKEVALIRQFCTKYKVKIGELDWWLCCYAD